jgi:hypothetical protein
MRRLITSLCAATSAAPLDPKPLSLDMTRTTSLAIDDPIAIFAWSVPKQTGRQLATGGP